jgi:hypothetical protein
MNIYEWRHQFFRKHGGVEAAIAELNSDGEPTGFYLFPDGARCEQSREGGCEEPPEDDAKRLRLVIRYREVVVQMTQEACTDLKNKIEAIHGHSNNFIGVIQYTQDDDLHDKSEALRVLKRESAKLKQKRQELDQAREQLRDLITPRSKRRHLRYLDQQIENQDHKFRDELKRIRF